MKKHVTIALILIMFLTTLVGCQNQLVFKKDDITTIALSHNGSFYTEVNGTAQETFLKGVNMGATIPGSLPGALAIDKEAYLKWFEQIYDMNANTIRIYTTMRPVFYEALYEFNQEKDVPLYILQGVWVNEEDIANLNDAYASDNLIITNFITDAKDLVDIFHGNKTLAERPGHASGTYSYDVSPYILGWILGIEWAPDFVVGTNDANPDKTSYKGDYLYTRNASPFEVCLAEVGDALLAYEAKTYQMTRPISYTNWLTTDLLTHPNEPDEREDMVSVNTEHIKTTNNAFAGMFASYHIYPYYPEFMNFEPEYQNWVDPDTGDKNPYKAYLTDLISHHDMPVLVAEVGIPSSRGMTHENPQGFNQGGHSEIRQGELLVDLFETIAETDAMGALIFSWQDEWFKRTWNTMDFDLSWRRPFWSNYETNEQAFGLLAMDPDNDHQTDGDMSEWASITPLIRANTTSIYIDTDERYLHILIEDQQINWQNDTIYIPMDTIPNQGNDSWQHESVSLPFYADFVIKINGENNSRIVVDNYYDANDYLYRDILNMITSNSPTRTINSGIFNPINHVLSAELALPMTNETIPFSSYEAGQLTYGNSNPEASAYNSLADYYFGTNFVEIRIPWLLLNVMDPSTKQIIADFSINHDQTFVPIDATGFTFSFIYDDISLTPATYDWDIWHTVSYRERLKPAYDMLKSSFDHMD